MKWAIFLKDLKYFVLTLFLCNCKTTIQTPWQMKMHLQSKYRKIENLCFFVFLYKGRSFRWLETRYRVFPENGSQLLSVYCGIVRSCSLKEFTLKEPLSWSQLYINWSIYRNYIIHMVYNTNSVNTSIYLSIKFIDYKIYKSILKTHKKLLF